jgi:hypothetical protein
MIKSTSCFHFESKASLIQNQSISQTLEISVPESNLMLGYRDLSNEKLFILKEIVSSEKKYLNDIKEIVHGYYDEISNQDYENNELLSIIFYSLKSILDFTR